MIEAPKHARMPGFFPMSELEGERNPVETRLHTLIFQLLRAQEEERKRISRELHDDLGQALGILKLRIGFLAKQAPEGQTALQKEFAEAVEYLADIIEKTRKLSHRLSPSILADLGLGTALRRLVSQFERLPQFKVISRIEGVDRLLPADAEINVYRVLQEALKNIEDHSEAENVSVLIERVGDSLFFLVEDDGRGFDIEEEPGPRDQGLGIATMRERARMMGATMSLQSRRGGGTRISFSIPVKEMRNLNGPLSLDSCR